MAGAAPAVASAAQARLGPQDWIMAAFAALAAQGPDAIRVEAIARDLGATKGSFYWHFKDLRALHQAMLEAWERLATTAITDAACAPSADPRAQVLRLVDLVSVLPAVESRGGALEPAMRDWARKNPQVAAVVARVDRQRIDDLAALLSRAGLGPDAAEEGAAAFYGALIGLDSLRATGGVAMRGALRRVAEGLLPAAA
jgi:AcrR family transcriptional regulator